MAVGDILQVTFKGFLHGQTILNTLHWYEEASGVGNPGNTLASNMDTRWTANIVTRLSNEFTHDETQAQRIFPRPPLVPSIAGPITPIPGGIAFNSLPTQNSAIITKRSPFAGVKYRGRMFLAGIPVNEELDSQLTTVYQDSLLTGATALLQNLTVAGFTWRPVIFHRATNTIDPITSFVVQRIIRAQRRRQVGRGV